MLMYRRFIPRNKVLEVVALQQNSTAVLFLCAEYWGVLHVTGAPVQNGQSNPPAPPPPASDRFLDQRPTPPPCRPALDARLTPVARE